DGSPQNKSRNKDHHDECRGIQRSARHRPEHFTESNVADAHRRRKNTVVGFLVMQLEPDVEESVGDSAVHTTRGEQAWRNESAVRDAVDQPAHASESQTNADA